MVEAVLETFARRAARTPSLCALELDDARMTYAALDEASNGVAHDLARRGIRPGAVVAVCFERSLAMIVALLGVLKAGAAFAPLDPEHPAERLRLLVSDLGTPFVLTTRDLAEKLPRLAVLYLPIDSGIEPEAIPPVVRVAPQDAAYIIYTSGSTGVPKAVVNTHDGLARRLRWPQTLCGLAPDEVVVQKTPYTFDVSVWEIFWPLLYGDHLVIARPGGHKDPVYLAELIRTAAVTTAHFVPSMLALFLAEPRARDCCTLRYILTSGEALSPATVARLHATYDRCELYNLYGPTEASIDVTVWQCTRGASKIPIGRPVTDTSVYVLDEDGAPCPDGASGELYLGGPQVARGYWRRPDLTAERFVADPFTRAPGARMYRTGDLGRVNADGAIEYLGRLDHQVKLRGFRIELGEIEHALESAPGVRSAVVIMRDQGHGDEARLVAYVTGDAPDPEALRARLSTTLPEYMVPSAIVALVALPLTASGKIDRAALPAPSFAPRDEAPLAGLTEHAVAAVWAEVLGIEGRLGAGDDFFRLGGQSLIAARVSARLAATTHRPVTVRDLFETRTVRALAARIDALTTESARTPFTRSAPSTTRPLSFAEERFWILQELDPETSAYNLAHALSLDGPVDVPRLESAIGSLVERHDTLRSTYRAAGGAAVATVEAPAPFHLRVVSVAEDEDASARAATLAAAPFDLARGPIFRAWLLERTATDHLLVLSVHHIAADGWSLEILARDLFAFYDGTPPPPLTAHYGDFAAWQRAAPVPAEEVGEWVADLAGAPPYIDLPLDRPRPARAPSRGAAVVGSLPAALTASLRSLAAEEGASLFMVVLAVYSEVVGRLSGQADVVVGVPTAQRPDLALEPVSGVFLNTLALRVRRGTGSFRERIRDVRRTALAAYARSETPFEAVVEALRPPRDAARTPIFQVMLNGLDFPRTGGIPGDIAVTRKRLPLTSAKCELELYIEEEGATTSLTLLYEADLFAPDRAREILAQVEELLAAADAQPDAPFAARSIVTEGARARLPDPRATLPAPRLRTVLERVDVHADERPTSAALDWRGAVWSYADLRTRSESIGASLRAHFGRGARILVGGARSPGLVAAILGVWRAGGVVVPFGEMPEERRRTIARESGANGCIVVDGPAFDDELATLRVDPRTGAPTVLRDGASRDERADDDAGYVFFTSGTTGKPKGILGSHQGLTHFVGWQLEHFGIGPADRAAQVTALSFDVVLRDMLTPLAAGATLAFPPRPMEELDPRAFLQFLRKSAITVLHSVPSILDVWLEEWRKEAPLKDLRLLFVAGEPLGDGLAVRLKAMFPAARIVNLYGPTETTLAKCFHELDELTSGTQPVGRPLPSAQALVLNEAGTLAGIGEVGEIVIRTPFRTLGYVDAGMNLPRFHPNPFTRDASDIVYATGDRGRYRLDGALDILGRVDDQVKIRGIRIEPAEVAAILRRHPDVASTFVRSYVDAGGQKALSAYVVVTKSARRDPDVLRAHLGKHLPRAVIPAVFVFLDAMPLTPNGKVDRAALPAEASALALPPEDDGAAENEIETQIADIWRAVLRIRDVGRNDNFFDLGGHSLNATQVASRIRDAFVIDVAVRTIFDAPTVAELAELVVAKLLEEAEEDP